MTVVPAAPNTNIWCLKVLETKSELATKEPVMSNVCTVIHYCSIVLAPLLAGLPF